MDLEDEMPLLGYEPVESSEDAIKVVAESMAALDREAFYVINRNLLCQPINYSVVSIGGIADVSVYVANVFKSAILSNAVDVVVIHNHPSGNLAPSQYDIKLTKRLIKAGKAIGIEVADHIIVAGRSAEYVSLKETTLLFN